MAEEKGRWQGFIGMIAGAAGVIFTLFVTKFRGAISSIFSLGAMWSLHSATALFPDEALKVAGFVSDSYFSPPTEWAGFVSSYFENMTGKKINLDMITKYGVWGAGKEGIEQIGDTFLRPMLGLIMPGSGYGGAEATITPQDGLDAAERFLGVNLQFQMSAWFLHLLGDIQSFGMFKSLKDLPNAISWSYGIGWLSWLVMGVPFKKGISEPLEVMYNRMYRPVKPTLSQLIDGRNSGRVTAAEFLDEVKNLGYDDRWIPLVTSQGRKKATQAQLELLMDKKLLTEDQARQELIQDGYSELLATLIVHGLANKDTDALYRKLADEAEKHYLNDLMTVGALKKFYDVAEYREEEQDLMITILDMQKARLVNPTTDTRNLSPANIGALYKNNEIDYRTAETMVVQTNFNPAQVDLFLALYKPAAEKEIPQGEATREVLGTLFVNGLVLEAELRAYLAKLKYSDEAIEYFVKYYRTRIKAVVPAVKVIKLSASQIGNLFKQGIISLNEAAQRLLDLNMLESDIAYFLALYEPVEEVTPEIVDKQLTSSQIGKLYEIGEINFDSAMARLIALGLSNTNSGLLLKLYEPAVPVPVEVKVIMLTSLQIGQLFNRGFVTGEEAAARLAELGMRQSDISDFLSLYLPPAPETLDAKTLRLAQAQVGKLFKTKAISVDEALYRLSVLGMVDRDARLYLGMYRPAGIAVEVEQRLSTVSEVSDLYRNRTIAADEATARLMALGYTKENAQATLRSIRPF